MNVLTFGEIMDGGSTVFSSVASIDGEQLVVTFQGVVRIDNPYRYLSPYLDALSAELPQLPIGRTSIDFTELQNRLNALLTDSHPWRNQARELMALAAMKANRHDDAKAQLERLLGDKELPGGMREQVTILMSVLAQAELARAQQGAAPAPAPKADAPKAETPAKK